MVVKERVGRKRYILVELRPRPKTGYPEEERVDGPKITRSELIYILNREFNKFRRRRGLKIDVSPPWLTVFQGKYAIFRSQYIYIKETIEFLNTLSLSHRRSRTEKYLSHLFLRTIQTAGTIKKLKKLKDNYILAEEARRPGRNMNRGGKQFE